MTALRHQQLPPASEAAAPPARIVIAEDSLVMRAVVRRHLEEQGYEVYEAEDGVEALQRCREAKPDAALLDVEMPGLDGHEVLRAMKADPELADIPVVFLTGRTTTADIVAGLKLGAHDYLKKPFEPAELIARVNAAVQTRRLQDELRLRNAELHLLSRTDPLTGLANRRHGQEYLVGRAAEAHRHHRFLSVLMLDVDHFKAVNDTYGHGGGDAVLRELAARIRAELRAGALAVRWGGEEFLLVLPETSAGEVVRVGQRILGAVRSEPFVIDAAQRCAVTVSGGWASSTDLVDGADDLVRRADNALYDAKAGGRDRVMPSDSDR